MFTLRDIYTRTNRPVGQTTLRRLLLAFIALIVFVSLFTALADEVLEGDTLIVDNHILLSIYSHSSPVLNSIILHLTNFGGVMFVIGITAIIAGYYMYRSKWQAFTQIVAGVGGAGLLNVILKLLFERDRPDLWHHLVFESTYSFPSGHAMGSSALAFSVVAILWHTKWRWLALSLASIYVLTIGFTRLYLGVHYPTDVIAGWCVSAAWVIAVATILGSIKRQPAKTT